MSYKLVVYGCWNNYKLFNNFIPRDEVINEIKKNEKKI